MVKKTYQQIQVQIAALQKEADVARKREVQNVIRDIKASIALYGLTADDLGLTFERKLRAVRGARKNAAAEGDELPVAKKRQTAAGAKRSKGSGKEVAVKKVAANKRGAKKPAGDAVAARFADGSGNTWSGRGPRPGWLKEAIAQGKSPDDFRV
jgi:DNA-binding protein H-NS